MTASPSETPNVVVSNPNTRRIVTTTLGAFGIILGAVVTADLVAPEFDLSAFTTPATAVYAFLAGVFGVGVIRPNTPKA